MNPGDATATAAREWVVKPPNGAREALWVAAAIAAVWLVVLGRAAMTADREAPLLLRPYQRLASTLSGDERALFQTLLSSVGDIQSLRDANTAWPAVGALDAEGVPPFDQELLPGGLRGFVWKENDGGSWVDYAATRDDSTSFILRVIDLHEKYHPHPHPGIDYDPRMRLAVQVWIYEEPNRAYPGERLPEAGWIWVVTPDDPSLRLPKAGERTVAATPSPETP